MSCTVTPLAALPMDGLRQAATGVLTKLPTVADMLTCQKIVASEGVLSPPALTLLENAAARVAGKLPLVHELKVLEQTISSLPALHAPP